MLDNPSHSTLPTNAVAKPKQEGERGRRSLYETIWGVWCGIAWKDWLRYLYLVTWKPGLNFRFQRHAHDAIHALQRPAAQLQLEGAPCASDGETRLFL